MNKPIHWIFAALLVAAGATTVALTSAPNLSRALEAQRALVRDNPYNASGYNDLGNLLMLADRYSEAEEAYRRAVDLSPEAVSPRYNLGLLLQQQRRLRDALDEFKQVLEQDADHAWARYQIGSIYESQDDKERAIRWYGEAFSLDPQLVFPEYNPSVIENELVEEAMLVGYKFEGSRPLAPRVYEQPRRIQELMLPPPAAEEYAEDEAMEGGEERAVEAEAPVEAEPMNDREVLSGQADSGEAIETLDAGDLDRRAVNQAPSAGSARFRNPRPRPQARSWQRPPATQRANPTQRPTTTTPNGRTVVQPGVVQGGTAQPNSRQAPGSVRGPVNPRPVDPTAPGTRVRTPRGSSGFTPGVSSTSRLELQLVPSSVERRG